MTFLTDKLEGDEYQKKVKDWINTNFIKKLDDNPKVKEIDLVDDGLTIEVKYDRQMKATGNIFLEYSCSKKESGVMKYQPSESSLFIYGNNEYALIFELGKLQTLVKEWIANKTYRLIRGGDGWRVEAVLLPIEEAKKFCQGIIYFN